jgi:threonine synthase
MPLSPFVTSLRCFNCGAEAEAQPRAYVCTACRTATGEDPGILDVQYDYVAAGEALRRALQGGSPRKDVFRYAPLLPVTDDGPGLLAGGTPLVAAPRLAAALGLEALYLKDETRNPTRCLKDRATAVGLAMAAVAGASDMYCASAGNAAISLAGFCAHAGRRCHVFVPSYASPTRLDWLTRYGADVRVSSGDYDQAFDEAETEGRARGWFSRNCALNPYLVEGKKTVAFEIAEQLEGRAPDLVVAPVGDGCTLGAAGKGFREMVLSGLLDRLPRLVGMQSDTMQPLVERVTGRAVAPATGERSKASSILVRRPRNALRLLSELEASGGTMLAISDDAISVAQARLAAEAGLVCEFTGAGGLAALWELAKQEDLGGKTAVVMITGGRVD